MKSKAFTIGREKLLEHIRNEMTYDDIAKFYNVTTSGIPHWLKIHGLQRIYKRIRVKREKRLQKKFRQLVKQGLYVRDIADKIGISTYLVMKWLKDFNLRTKYKTNTLTWHQNFDWDKINRDYKNVLSIEGVCLKYRISEKRLYLARKMGLFHILSDKEREIKGSIFPNIKTSYPEKYFGEKLKNTNFIRGYKFGKYTLDFCDPVRKIDLELDGQQHYEEPQLSKDIIRNKFINDAGYTVIRIGWKDFLKRTRQKRDEIINDIINSYGLLITSNDNCVKILYSKNKNSMA
jgi:very-short-patch-repair endonuclease/transposase